MSASANEVTEMAPHQATRSELERVHSSKYLDEVLNEHRSSQWSGPRPDLAELATTFVGGTLIALDLLLLGKTKTAIHFPGAKHHAQLDYSSGFCVFADFALAACIASKDYGKKVAILDIDAHHGDGTENLTADNLQVLTFSIHEKGIFPGTGNEDDAKSNVFNFPLSIETGKGDAALQTGIALFLELTQSFKPDLIFIACGADAHNDDPLSSLQYSVNGYKAAAKQIRNVYAGLPILVGGAGGYLPDTKTPEVWANFAHEISKH